MTLYIATLAEIKADLGITDADDDLTLQRWLLGLQGRFDTHCRRTFLYQAVETEIFDGGAASLYMRRWPITGVHSIKIDADQDWDAAAALSSADYVVAPRRGRIVYGRGTGNWPDGAQNIQVVYAGGFVKSDGTAAAYVDEGDLQALKRAFAMQASYEWRNRRTLGMAAVSAQGVNVQQSAGGMLSMAGQTLLPEVESALKPLVRML